MAVHLVEKPAAAVPSDSFTEQLAAMLKISLDMRKTLIFHMQGAKLKGVVKEIHAASLIVSNHESPRILLRYDRIDALETS